MEISFKGTMAEFYALFIGRVYAVGPPPEGLPHFSEKPNLDDFKVDGWASEGEAVPAPSNEAALAAKEMLLPDITQGQREEAWLYFVSFCAEWVKGFEADEDTDQPDRLQLMRDLGQGKWPIPVLVMAYEIKSLQRLVEQALVEGVGLSEEDFDSKKDYLDFVGRVAANMVQVSHMGFPDLAGTYDYSEKWKRS